MEDRPSAGKQRRLIGSRHGACRQHNRAHIGVLESEDLVRAPSYRLVLRQGEPAAAANLTQPFLVLQAT